MMLGFFMAALFISGLTAIPVDWQLSTLLRIVPQNTQLYEWLNKVLAGYRHTNEAFPFLLYGYDWLAFAHIVLAILFFGPYKDPVRNIWVVRFGMIAAVLIIPAAFIAGPFRDIPLGWMLIDSSFGVFALALLYPCYRKIRALETEEKIALNHSYNNRLKQTNHESSKSKCPFHQ